MYFTTSTYSTNHSSGLLSTHSNSESSLLSNNTGASILNPMGDASYDTGSIGGKDILFGNPDFSNMGPACFTPATHVETSGSMAFNSAETVGSVAFSGAETVGSVAFSGAETSGSVACGGDSGGGGFSSLC